MVNAEIASKKASVKDNGELPSIRGMMPNMANTIHTRAVRIKPSRRWIARVMLRVKSSDNSDVAAAAAAAMRKPDQSGSLFARQIVMGIKSRIASTPISRPITLATAP